MKSCYVIDRPTVFNVTASFLPHTFLSDNITSIYTSGRKCNFQGKGCDANHFDPINVNGWFWAGANNKRLPPTNAPDPNTFWSAKGA